MRLSSATSNQLPITSFFKNQTKLDTIEPLSGHSSPKCSPPSTVVVSKPIKTPPAAASQPPAARPKRPPKPCPAYKVVAGTRFAVDAFQFGAIADVDCYFLTHFHADHYVGLRRSFDRPLYASRITARLVRELIGVDARHVHEHDIDAPFVVAGVEVTALDANQ